MERLQHTLLRPQDKGNTELAPLSLRTEQGLLTATHTENLKTQTALAEIERR